MPAAHSLELRPLSPVLVDDAEVGLLSGVASGKGKSPRRLGLAVVVCVVGASAFCVVLLLVGFVRDLSSRLTSSLTVEPVRRRLRDAAGTAVTDAAIGVWATSDRTLPDVRALRF